MRMLSFLCAVGLLIAVGGCDKKGSSAGGSGAVSLTGAGATFPYPLYSKWMDQYSKQTGVRMNYQSIGSGGGIKQITERTVDFGASDGPMSDEQLSKASGKILHIPTVLGAVVPVYNLKEAKKPLVFTGPVLADIFLGRIKKWNDSRLVELNPDAGLPEADITVVHRSDGSGTTYIWVDYLSKVSIDWAAGPGRGTSVQWPVGLGGKGNEGVTGIVDKTPGTIGYVELIYALSRNIAFGEVKNKAGKPIKASMEAVSVAAAGAATNMPEDLRVSITDADGADVYPISGFTYLLVYQQQQDAAKGKALVDFLWWALHDGQAYAPPLHYAALAPEVVSLAEQKVKSITADGKPLLQP